MLSSVNCKYCNPTKVKIKVHDTHKFNLNREE